MYPILTQIEKFDVTTTHVDWVIESLWYMFSTTYARCYSFFYPNEDIIILFYDMFRDDFLPMEFMERW